MNEIPNTSRFVTFLHLFVFDRDFMEVHDLLDFIKT